MVDPMDLYLDLTPDFHVLKKSDQSDDYISHKNFMLKS